MVNPDRKSHALALLGTLAERYPVIRQRLPLKIGVRDDLAAALPDVDRRVLRRALGLHCSHPAYLSALCTDHARRYDLEGTPGDPVSPEARTAAAAKWARQPPRAKPPTPTRTAAPTTPPARPQRQGRTPVKPTRPAKPPARPQRQVQPTAKPRAPAVSMKGLQGSTLGLRRR